MLRDVFDIFSSKKAPPQYISAFWIKKNFLVYKKDIFYASR